MEAERLKTYSGIVLLILWANQLIWTAIAFWTGAVPWGTQSLLGTLVLLVTTLIWWKKQDWVYNALFVALLLGVFGLVSYHSTYGLTSGLGILGLSITVSQFPTVVLIAYVILDRKQFKRQFQRWLSIDQDTKGVQANSESNHYKRVFKDLTVEAIEDKLTQDINASARIALEELLAEKSGE